MLENIGPQLYRRCFRRFLQGNVRIVNIKKTGRKEKIMIKCIATDMDGTLLNSMQEITAENKEAILEARRKGVEVVVATGRSYAEAMFVLNQAGLSLPVINVNGAEVRGEGGEIIEANPLEKTKAREVISILKDQGIYFEIYTSQGTFTEDREKGVSVIFDIFSSANPDAPPSLIRKGAEERFEKGLAHVVESYDSLFEDESQPFYKILAFTYDEEKQRAGREALAQIEGLAVSSSGHLNIEVTSLNAQKGTALEGFVKAKGISMSETMAIGDNENDLSMLRRAGRSVAMGNASALIKGQCDLVTLSNDQSGVAKAIMEVI